VEPIFYQKKNNKLLAHSDAFPTYKRKLKMQFKYEEEPPITINQDPVQKLKIDEIYNKLYNKYDLEVDFFQTTIMLYDTNIIKEDTFDNLHKLMLEYPISQTNDQGIIALYFTNIDRRYDQIQTASDYTYYYDFCARFQDKPYIMRKR